MPKNLTIFLVIATALGGPGCAAMQASSPTATENKELRRMLSETKRELDEVRRDQEHLRATVEYLQYAKGSGDTAGTPGYPPPGNRLGAADWPRDQWNGRETFGGSARDYAAGAMEPPAGTVQQEIAASQAGPEALPQRGAYGSNSPDRGVGTPIPPAPDQSGIVASVRGGGAWTEPGGSGIEELVPTVPSSLRGSGYDDGVRSFVEEQYDDAIQYFRDYIYSAPQSGHADDAQYWIAESYLRKGLYSNAIKEFNQVVLRYGSGDRSAGALLKLAEVFSKIGDQVDARLSLQKLVNRYPGSSEASEAYRLLEQMGG